MNRIGFRIEALEEERSTHAAVPPVDFQHALCEGATGAGKTASLILPTLQERIGRGHTIVFLDHKGHEHRKVKALAEQAGRLEDVVEIGKPHAAHINLLHELDVLEAQEMIRDGVQAKDPYWNNSAANLLGDMLVPLRKLCALVESFEAWVSGPSLVDKLRPFGIDADQAASFETLAEQIASVEKMKRFQETLRQTANNLEDRIVDIYRSAPPEQTRTIHAQLIAFQKSTHAIKRFSLSTEGSSLNSGNNAVLQILDNAIATYARREWMNHAETTLMELLERRAILIVDTQSFGEGMLKVFFESLLKKSVDRIRTGSPAPVSVFVDEANRVLSPSFDTHIDVLREARVELIMAIQNVEQMVEKFSFAKWHSIEKNIKHHYTIGTDHRVLCNHSHSFVPRPLVFSEATLIEAERSFFALAPNRKGLNKNFLSEKSRFPKRFRVLYDPATFDHHAAILIEPEEGEVYRAYYHGYDTIRQIRDYVTHTLPQLLKEEEPYRPWIPVYESEPDELFYEDDDPFDPLGGEIPF